MAHSLKRGLVVVLAGLVTAPSIHAETSVVDATGRNFACPTTGARIITLAPNLSEIVDDLGRGNTLVGVASKEYWNPAAKAEDVGPYYSPDLEKIVSLRPTLIFAVKDGTPLALFEKLRERKLPVFASRVDSLADLHRAYQDVGCLLGAADAATKLIRTFDEKWNTTAAKLRQIPPAQRNQALLLVSESPAMAVNSGTFLGDVFSELGFSLVHLPYKQKYPEIDREWLSRADVKNIFVLLQHDHKTLRSWPQARVTYLRHPAWLKPSIHVADALKELLPPETP
jgi:iron complex transport system substrate-binding protein